MTTWRSNTRTPEPPPEPPSKPDYAAVQIAYIRQQLGRPQPPRPPDACNHTCPAHCEPERSQP